MRSMAHVELIDEVVDIPDADKIQAYRIGGWMVVDSKGKYQVGDTVIFCEIDSWIPHHLAPFLSKGKEPREFQGIDGERLRTVRLRKQLSQGLILPTSVLISSYEVGTDVTEMLGIVKWEAPVNANLQGVARGNFPSWGRKTDQERIQNLQREFQKWYDEDVLWEVTVKMDGSSMSVGRSPEGDYTVCSRNLMLELDQEGNAFVNKAAELNLKEITESWQFVLNSFNHGFLIQGELCGEGIQGNQEGITGHLFFVYDIYLTQSGGYLCPKDRRFIIESMSLDHVPTLHREVTLRELGLDTVQKVLDFAEGASWNSPIREGVVFKSVDGKHSFKAISNKWLEKNDK